MPFDRLALPLERFASLLVVHLEDQEPVHQARDDVASQRQPGLPILIALPLPARVLQERRVRKDIRRRCPELAEKLLSREQSVASFC